MTRKSGKPENDAGTLRRQAEARLEKGSGHAKTKEKETSALLRELQVHQIELEIQNEELRASQALIEDSRKRFVELYEFAPVGYGTLDDDGTLRYVNLTFVSLLMYNRRYVLGKPLSVFVHREDKDTVFLFLRRLRQTKGQQRCELRLKRKGGEVFFAELISVPLDGKDNTATQFLVAVLEIDSRKRAEEELRIQRGIIERDREFLGSVLDGIEDVFLAVDKSGRLSYLNHNAEVMFGRNREAVLGKHFSIAFPECKNVKLDEQRFRSFQEGNPATFDVFYPEEPFSDWYEIRLYPFSEGTCVFITVITQRRKTQEELEEHARRLDFANKEMEAFSYSVSHDLNAPLRTMKSFADILLEDYSPVIDAQGRDLLARIAGSANRMQGLIDNLLDLSRVSRIDVHFQEINLGAIAKNVLNELHESQPDRAVDVKVDETLKVIADPQLMYITLTNLLGNAWKFTGKTENPAIEFGSFRENNERVLFVKDNGAGFDPKYSERLFTPFQRLHSEKQFSGSGVGLSIVGRIISRHKGRIWAESEQNRGATFYFVLGVDTCTNDSCE